MKLQAASYRILILLIGIIQAHLVWRASASAPDASSTASRRADAISLQSQGDLILGSLTAEVYTGLGGTLLQDLRNSTKYRQNRPDRVELVTIFEYPPGTATRPPSSGNADNYGVKLTGYIIPTETANYVFYLTSDDNGELFLSSDENPGNQTRIARESQYNNVREFASTARRAGCPAACENVSRPIRLEAGKRYSVRAEMKEGGGGDNLSVTWTKVGQPKPVNGAVPILGAFLATDRRPPQPPRITLQPSGIVAATGSSVTLQVDASGADSITYQWLRNGIPISGATSRNLTLSNLQAASAGDYSVVVGSASGSTPSQVAPVGVVTTSGFRLSLVSGPVSFSGNGHLYYLLDAATWVNAENAAVALGGHLAAINNRAEQDFLFANFANFAGVARNPWIGFRDGDSSRNSANITTRRTEFVWATGETVTYSNWTAGEPNNAGGEYVVQMTSGAGTWNDAVGSTRLSGIVEINLGSKPPLITLQPQGQSVLLGATVTFAVEASGATPLSYQWRRSGVPIPGATGATLTLANAQRSDAADYSVVVSNNAGSVTSHDAALLLPPDPNTGEVIFNNRVVGVVDVRVILPDGAPAGAGWTAQLYAGPAAGALAPLFPVTRFRTTSDATLGYVDQVVVSVTGVKPGERTTLVMRVFNGSSFETSTVGLESNPFTVVVGGGTLPPPNLEGLRSITLVKSDLVKPFVERLLPASYQDGQKLSVTLKATPPNNINVYAVEDSPPNGWIVGAITDGGIFDAGNKKVKWGPFFDRNARTLTYEVTPPVGETGPKQFAGASSIDGLSVPIIGVTTTDSTPPFHPADNQPADGRITIDEVTGYGLAWKKGSVWPAGPNPIPIDYVTWAAALWMDGEAYRLDPTKGPAPKWWISAPTARPLSLHSLRSTSDGVPSAVSTLPPLFVAGETIRVQILVKPPASASAYAIEETIPQGWSVTGITEGGTFDSVNAQVKWGPFFDNAVRELAYDVTSAMESPESVAFSGMASFDGGSVGVSGQRQSKLTSRLKSLSISPQGEFEMDVKGGAGKQFVVEASSNLQDWVVVGTVVNSTGKIKFTDPAASREGRFFRVVVK